MISKRSFLPAFAFVTLLASSAHADLYFSMFTGQEGAIARMEAATDGATPPKETTIYADKELVRLERVVSACGGERLISINEDNNLPALIIIDPRKSAQFPPTRVTLPDRPTNITTSGDLALVAGSEGKVSLVNAREGRLIGSVDLRTDVSPTALRASRSVFSPDNTRALVSITQGQTDRRPGGRLILLELPSLKQIGDLQFAADHPELHFGPDSKDNGPGPDMLLSHQGTNTLLIALRTYGAIATADLDAAFNGQWKNLSVQSSAADGSWGTAFPFAGSIIESGGKPYAYISNASVDGGSLLMDLATRKIAWHIDSGPRAVGSHFYQAGANRLVAVHSGLYFFRGAAGIEDKHKESSDVFTIQLDGVASGIAPVVRKIDFPDFIYQVVELDPAKEDIVLIANRRPADSKLFFWTYDLSQKRTLSQVQALGVVRNFVTTPTR